MQSIKQLRADTHKLRFGQALAQVFQRTLRILLDDSRIIVQTPNVYGGNPAPAWSDIVQRRVTIDPEWLDGMATTDAVRTAKGLLYHEASHLLCTPAHRAGSNRIYGADLWDVVSSVYHAPIYMQDVFNHFNVLEDKRIENLFVLRYPPARFYFAEPLYRLIVKDKAVGPVDTYISIVGRPWLDRSVVGAVRAEAVAIKGADWADDVDRTARDFMLLSNKTLRNDITAVAEVLIRWIKLVRDVPLQNLHSCANDHSLANEGEHAPALDRAVQKGEKWSETGGKNSNKQEDAQLTEDDLDELSNLSPSGDSDADETAEGSDGADGTTDGNESSGDLDNAEDSCGSDGEAGDSHGNGATEGDGVHTSGPTNDAQQAAQSALDDVTEAIMEDVADTQRAVGRLMGNVNSVSTSTASPIWKTDTQSVDSEMTATARQLSTHLSEVRNAAAPEWLKGETVGRLNVMRDLMYEDTDRLDVFDLWDNGHEDEMNVHVNLCIDLSTSMDAHSNNPPYVQAAKAVWTLREAFERVDHTVDVYGFAGEYQRLTERHLRRSYTVWNPNGNTAPAQMMRDIILRSQSLSGFSQRLLVVLTDGNWPTSESEAASNLTELWRGMGGISHLFMIRSHEYQLFKTRIMKGDLSGRNPHGFDEWTAIDTPLDMIQSVGGIVKQLMRNHLT